MMRLCKGQVLIAVVASLVLLGGCETSTKLGDFFKSKTPDDSQATGAIAGEPAATGSVGREPGDLAAAPGLLGSDAYDDLNMGKQFYRSGNHGLAERYFRRAVEARPRDGEAWIGLAASYDQLRRFELADRAYGEATKIVGQTSEVLNNRGYSYMLRGDYRRARTTLLQAQAKDPANPYIQNNLDLLAKSARKRKAID